MLEIIIVFNDRRSFYLFRTEIDKGVYVVATYLDGDMTAIGEAANGLPAAAGDGTDRGFPAAAGDI